MVSMPAFAAEVKIDDLIVAKTIPAAQRDNELKAAKAFYQFRNTGDESLLKAAISPNFTDTRSRQADRRVRRGRPSHRNISRGSARPQRRGSQDGCRRRLRDSPHGI
jgi:hypothetical protein